ncbi:MAG: virulence RhuM family protein [Bacteroidales bacterium]|nr:virulence RhuM family protein [Bacteroidales bacterium]
MVISNLEITTQHGAIEGKTQTLETQFYNLDAIISVGYRVNSAKATHFRIWATNVLKSDVMVAKNYLQEQEIKRLERAVTGYFDYIEDLVERENTFTMEEFAASVNEFLSFRKYQILTDRGKVSRIQAERKAGKEYGQFNKTQKIESDFDKVVKKLK